MDNRPFAIIFEKCLRRKRTTHDPTKTGFLALGSINSKNFQRTGADCTGCYGEILFFG
jgi:hypothetical protein